jgi:hypothetical protein
MATPFFEPDARPYDEISHGARYQDLAWARLIRNPCSDVNGDPSDLLADNLTLAGMDTDSGGDPQYPDCFGDNTPTANGPCGPVEGRKHSVASRVDLPTSEARELASRDRMVAIQKVTPVSVTQPRGLLCGTHDVDKHDGRQHTVGLVRLAYSSQELLDFREQAVDILGKEQVINPRQLHVPRALDALGQVATMFWPGEGIPGSV